MMRSPAGVRRAAFAIGALVVVLQASAAVAQDAGRVEVSGALRWIGTVPFEPVDANETALGGVTRPLFSTSSQLESSAGVEARVGVRLFSGIYAEGSIAVNRTNLSTQITGDKEGAGDLTVAEAVTQYLMEGGIRAALRRWRAGQLAPFAEAGLGYVRQLHDGRMLVETGRAYYVGGGVAYALTTGTRRIKATGLRGEVRAVWFADGVVIDAATHVAPSISAGYFVRF